VIGDGRSIESFSLSPSCLSPLS